MYGALEALGGVSPQRINAATIRTLERASIREYVSQKSGYLNGRVLDFGAGKSGTCLQPEPYRSFVHGEYVPFDLGDDMPGGMFDAILMTQVIQYLDSPLQTLLELRGKLRHDGVLVITGPTNWAEVESADLWRFTRAGIRRLLEKAFFSVLDVSQRAEVELDGFVMSLGWGAVAAKQ